MTAAVITLSDKGSRGEREDESGPEARTILEGAGFSVAHYKILPDDRETIRKALMEYTDKVDLIVTTGGTGLSPRDVTPEATLDVIDRPVPGIAEAMRAAGLSKTPRSMLSRAVAGARGGTLIVNLPGSRKAVREGLEAILEVLPHAVEKLRGSGEDCGR